MAVIDIEKVRTAALLMHFDASWVGRILDGRDLLLSDDEKALFRHVDRRGFRADEERKARAAAAVVAEGPVAVAVAGLPRLFAFFTSPAFLVVVRQGAPLVERALVWLGPVGRLEASIARARRRRRHRGPLSLVAGADAERGFRKGTVAAWSGLLSSLGPDPATAVQRGARRAWPLGAVAGAGVDDDDAGIDADDDAREGVIVENALVDPAVGACSHGLATVLLAARVTGDAQHLRAVARVAGCDDDNEADALLADLVRDGLLVPPASPAV